MKVSLIRHGQSFFNIGIKDFPENNLTAIGKMEVKNLAKILRLEKIDAIYCSPTTRALETMDEILRGRDREEIKINLSRLLMPKAKKNSWESLKNRVEIFMQDLEAEHTNEEHVLVISHQKVIQMFLHKLGKEIKKIDHAQRIEIDLA